MATEFNYIANVDTTRVMGAVAEIRSQIGMAFSSPTAFVSSAASIVGGGADFSGGASSAARQTMSGFGRFTPNMFGGTFTNAAMAYTPHYGMMLAQTTLAQELRVNSGGLQAAASMAPPGVAASEYFLGAEKNLIGRQVEASHNARLAATTSFVSAAGGLLAGEMAYRLGGKVGERIGSGVASSIFGTGAAKAGAMIGGLYLGFKAFDWAQEKVGGAIKEHYANIERIGGITRELGELAGAGRGLSRTQRYNLGVAARGAASDLKMDVQEMGSILATGRELGMLPSSTNPEKARQQFRDFAKAIEEGAQVLHTSLANAAQVIRTATSNGMTSREGVIHAAAMGGPGAFNRYMAFGSMGGRIAEANLLSRKQGFGLFTGAVGAMSGAGMSHAEMRMLGGKYGAATMMAQTQMAAALSPMGDMQLMASLSGEALGGPFDIAAQAITSMGEGGDFIGNAIRFQTHKRAMLRGVGAKGIRTMAKSQVEGMAEMYMSLSPNVSREDARIFSVMNSMGKNELQAKAYVQGLFYGGGGGGLGARGKARALIAMQDNALGDISVPLKTGGGGHVSVLGTAFNTALVGGMMSPTPTGVIGGAVVGAIGAIGYNSWETIKGIFSGGSPPLFASAQEKADFYERQQASEIDRRMSAQKARIGYLDINEDIAAAAFRSNLGGARLDLDAMGSQQASRMVAGRLAAAGVRTVGAGIGTIKIKDQYYSTTDVQEVFDTFGKKRTVKKTDDEMLVRLAGQIGGSHGLQNDIGTVNFSASVLSGASSLAQYMPHDKMGALALQSARNILARAGNTPEAAAVRAEFAKSGISGPLFRGLMTKLGGPLPEFNEDVAAGMAIAGGAQGMQKTFAERERAFVSDVFDVGSSRIQSEIRSLSAKRARLNEEYPLIAWGEDLNGRAMDVGKKIEEKKALLAQYEGVSTRFIGSDFYQRARSAEIAGDTQKVQPLLDLAKNEAQAQAPEGVHLPAHLIEADRRLWRRSTISEDGIVGSAASSAAKQIVGGSVRNIMGTYAQSLAQRAGEHAESRVRSVVGSGFMGSALGTAAKAVVETVAEQSLVNERTVVEAVSKIPVIGGLLTTKSWAEQVKEEHAALAGTKPPAKSKKRGAGTMVRAIGWGARENALDSINRSLRHTERSLSSLEKRLTAVTGESHSPANSKNTTGQPS